jgi:hypothetical protein
MGLRIGCEAVGWRGETRLACLEERPFGKPALAVACSRVDEDAADAAVLLMMVQLRIQVQKQLRLPVLQPVS